MSEVDDSGARYMHVLADNFLIAFEVKTATYKPLPNSPTNNITGVK